MVAALARARQRNVHVITSLLTPLCSLPASTICTSSLQPPSCSSAGMCSAGDGMPASSPSVEAVGTGLLEEVGLKAFSGAAWAVAQLQVACPGILSCVAAFVSEHYKNQLTGRLQQNQGLHDQGFLLAKQGPNVNQQALLPVGSPVSSGSAGQFLEGAVALDIAGPLVRLLGWFCRVGTTVRGSSVACSVWQCAHEGMRVLPRPVAPTAGAESAEAEQTAQGTLPARTHTAPLFFFQ